ncbi:MAG: ABC transporter permease, partial [Oscillospiraceae bacterium]|nr:ABC transporter permease [Oscillospiraceae bacterium]
FIWILFSILNPNFLAVENINGIMNSCSLAGTIAIGVACLMMSGSIDLSAGAEGALGGVIAAMLLASGVSCGLTLVIVIAIGAVMGLINAFWANGLKMMPFISTIAMSSIFSAIAQILTKGNDIAVGNKAFTTLGTGHLWIFPMPFVIMVVLMVIYGLMLSYTKFGRQLILCGGNRTAARLAGLNYSKITTIMFANCGAISAFAGAILAARMHVGASRAVIGAEMDAITAAIIGGVSFLGGGKSGMGTIFVALVLTTSFSYGLQAVKVSSFWQIVTRGGLLLLALIVDYFRETRRQKALAAGNA